MPLTIEEWDKLDLIGGRGPGVLEENVQGEAPGTQNGIDWSPFRETLHGLSKEEKTKIYTKLCIRVYSGSLLKKFADSLCLLSPSERLLELRSPLSSIRWFYSLSLEHMLEVSGSPLANARVAILHAAQEGLEVCVSLCPAQGRWESIEAMSKIFGFHVAVEYILPDLLNWKLDTDVAHAMSSHTLSIGDQEASADCSVCCESLHLDEEPTDKEGQKFLQPKHKGELYFVVQDFTKFVWNQEMPMAVQGRIARINKDAAVRESNFSDVYFSRFETEAIFSLGRKAFNNWKKKGFHSGGPNSASPKPPILLSAYMHVFQRKNLRQWKEEENRAAGQTSAPPKASLVKRACGKAFSDWKEKGAGVASKTRAAPKQSLAKLSCNHIFHKACVKPWLITNGTCPNCRYFINSIPRPIHSAEDDYFDAGDDLEADLVNDLEDELWNALELDLELDLQLIEDRLRLNDYANGRLMEGP